MPEESAAEPAEPVDGEPEDGASRHRSRTISCSVRGSTEEVGVDAPNNRVKGHQQGAKSRNLLLNEVHS